MVVFLRSLLFNVIFYVWVVTAFIISMPLLALPRKQARVVVPFIIGFIVFILRTIVGIRYEVRGQKYLQSGPVIVASKHQSAWDTMIYLFIIPDVAIVLKDELAKIPIYGHFIRKLGMLPIRRTSGTQAIRQLIGSVNETLEQDRKVLIFPEGTRSKPGDQIKYQRGIAMIYKQSGTSVVPVALNSGLYWGKRKFLRYPGTIIIEYLPPIEPGLSLDEFMENLTTSIETASNQLIEEAKRG